MQLTVDYEHLDLYFLERKINSSAIIGGGGVVRYDARWTTHGG
jgi:hypothetical protein